MKMSHNDKYNPVSKLATMNKRKLEEVHTSMDTDSEKHTDKLQRIMKNLDNESRNSSVMKESSKGMDRKKRSMIQMSSERYLMQKTRFPDRSTPLMSRPVYDPTSQKMQTLQVNVQDYNLPS